MSTNELCLLILKIVEKRPDEAKKIRDIIKSRVKKLEDIESLLLLNFNIMMNMRVEEDKDLKDLTKKEEKEEKEFEREEESESSEELFETCKKEMKAEEDDEEEDIPLGSVINFGSDYKKKKK